MSNKRHLLEIRGGQFKRPRGNKMSRQRFAGLGLTKAEQDAILERQHRKVNDYMKKVVVAGVFRPQRAQGDR